MSVQKRKILDGDFRVSHIVGAVREGSGRSLMVRWEGYSYLGDTREPEEHVRPRSKVQKFVGAARREEIVFTRGASEAINLVANTWGAAHLGPGDEVILRGAKEAGLSLGARLRLRGALLKACS